MTNANDSYSNTVVTSGGILIAGQANTIYSTPITLNPGAELVFALSSGATTTSVTDSGTYLESGSSLATKVNIGSTVVNGAMPTASLVPGGYTYPSVISITPNRVAYVITCYAAGTLIRSAEGDRAVESIAPGDLVTVMRDGEPEQEPVAWVGSTRVDLSRHAHPETAAPIRVKAGALAEGLPSRDLVLSPEHCLILRDRCVPVKLLVNGASIVREFPAEPFTYYHLELERHGILLAEGAPSGSYLDTGNRRMFDAPQGPTTLHPTFDTDAASKCWDTDACAPLAAVPGEVAPIWQALAQRALDMGLTVPTPSLVEDPDLHLIVDGRRLQPASDRNSRAVLMVPAGARSVVLASRFCIPADKMVPGLRDTRRLGVSVNRISIRTMTQEVVMPADHPGLARGWNDSETDGASLWRWTDGAAEIPWDGIAASAVLTVHFTPVAQYPV